MVSEYIRVAMPYPHSFRRQLKPVHFWKSYAILLDVRWQSFCDFKSSDTQKNQNFLDTGFVILHRIWSQSILIKHPFQSSTAQVQHTPPQLPRSTNLLACTRLGQDLKLFCRFWQSRRLAHFVPRISKTSNSAVLSQEDARIMWVIPIDRFSQHQCAFASSLKAAFICFYCKQISLVNSWSSEARSWPRTTKSV